MRHRGHLHFRHSSCERGWTICLPEPLSIGVAPTNLSALIKQRTRWCHGNLRMLFLKRGRSAAPGYRYSSDGHSFTTLGYRESRSGLLLGRDSSRMVFHQPLSTSAALGCLAPADNVFCHHLRCRLVVSTRRGSPGSETGTQSLQRIHRAPNRTGDIGDTPPRDRLEDHLQRNKRWPAGLLANSRASSVSDHTDHQWHTFHHDKWADRRIAPRSSQ